MKKVVIIGGGIAGMEAASYLSSMGYEITLIEKAPTLGGHVSNWDRLFPSKRLGREVLDFIKQGITDRIALHLSTSVASIEKKENGFIVNTSDKKSFAGDALLLTTGYDLFDARKKEEYGYGIYDNVITSAELEIMFSRGLPIITHDGRRPQKVAFIHCVGSRDEKVGNINCSKVCCVTAVKQAIEIKDRFPDSEVFSFYMDLRMFGMKFETLYKEAQEKHGIEFIRGRLSEACENRDGTVVLKAEDTLTGRQLKLTVDLLVLMVGFVPSEGSKQIANLLGLQMGAGGFIGNVDEHTLTNSTSVPGVFVAGGASAPRTITNTLTDARAAALKIASYLQNLSIENRSIPIFG